MTAVGVFLTLTRRIKASPAKVFAAFLEPELIRRWWGPDAGPVLTADVDARVDGHFRVVFRTLDGTTCDCSGTYREITPNHRIVFTWNWAGDPPERETLITIALKAVSDGTELTMVHAGFDDAATRDGHRQGWAGSLDKLERLFADH